MKTYVRSGKCYEGLEILPHLLANELSNIRKVKKRGTQLLDQEKKKKRGPYYSKANSMSSMLMFFHLTSMGEGAQECCSCSGVAGQLRNPNLGRFGLLVGDKNHLPNLCLRERYYLYYTGQQTELPSVLEETL